MSFQVTVSTTSGGAWLSATPVSGTVGAGAPIAVSVTADPAGLGAGTYSGEVRVTSSEDSSQSVISTRDVGSNVMVTTAPPMLMTIERAIIEL